MLADHVLALRPTSWAIVCPHAEHDAFTCTLVSTAVAAFMAGPPPAQVGLFRVGVEDDGSLVLGGRL